MEHLEGVINKPEVTMSPQELQLHYFKMHDYDGNSLLDGLELSIAITHVHKEVGPTAPGEESQSRCSVLPLCLSSTASPPCCSAGSQSLLLPEGCPVEQRPQAATCILSSVSRFLLYSRV